MSCRIEAGGQGEIVSTTSDQNLSRSDMQQIERAVNQRWETDPKIKKALLSKVARIGLTTDKARTLLACTRCYMAAEKQNQEDEYRAKVVDSPERIEQDDIRGQLGQYRVVS